MSDRLLIVIATYNEVDTLPALVKGLQRNLPQATILVIDDNSPDGTGSWCDNVAQRNPQFRVIHRTGKLGLGTATIRGLQQSLDGPFELVATMDADLSHDPAALAAMLETLLLPTHCQYDVIIGSRYVRGGEIHGWPWYRRVASFLVNQYARFILKLPVYDSTSALRIYRTSTLRQVNLELLRSPGYAYLEEILVLLKQHGAKFTEYPIIFQNRETGASKVDPKELASSLSEILKLSFRSYKS